MRAAIEVEICHAGRRHAGFVERPRAVPVRHLDAGAAAQGAQPAAVVLSRGGTVCAKPGVTRLLARASGIVSHPVPGHRRPTPDAPMFKYLLILALGVALGYSYGWKDAQVNEKHIAERMLDGVGGATRERMGNDIDGKYSAEGK